MSRVVNLLNPDQVIIYSLPPHEAVRNAHAQFELRNQSTWKYSKYNDLVFETPFTFICGNMCVLKQGES